MHKILLVFGTRPELIKLAPIISEFRKRGQRERLYIINTGQHSNLIKRDLEYFQIDIDHEFKLNRTDDSLSLLNGLMLLEFNALKLKLKNLDITIDAIIAQGDTCTTFSAAQHAFYEKIPFIHIEAGLRTYDFSQPFPEEYYRKTISSITSIHFAPTISAEKNLIAEGFSPEAIMVTGNTVIDNLRNYRTIDEFKKTDISDNNLVLITIHRRENIKNNLKSIIDRLISYIRNNPDKSFLWIDNPGYKIAPSIDIQLDNLKIIQPVSFNEMVEIYKRTQLIITDSGGIQEEASFLGIPTLLYRLKTEREEGIDSGISKYLTEDDIDLDSVIKMLNATRTSEFNTIFGDGYASGRIVDFLADKGI